MRSDGPEARVLARLEAEVTRATAGRDELVVAFSGGLGSLLIAALARKRCELVCVVVGMRGSADVEAARVAQKFLDYRVTVLRPSPLQALSAARRIAESESSIPLADGLALVPLALVEARHPGSLVLSGAGLTARTASLRRALGQRAALSPGLRSRFRRSGRSPLLRLAAAAGLPESFALAAPRSPLEGSGIGPVLRAMAHRRGMSVPRFLSVRE